MVQYAIMHIALERIGALEGVLRISSAVKNVVIVIIAAFFAFALTDVQHIVLASFSLTCVTSAMYAYNALTDVRIDMRNVNKQHRASAVRRLPERFIRTLTSVLALIGISLGFTFSMESGLFHMLLAGELFLYSFPLTRFKEKPVLDIIFGAVLSFGLRYFAAWYALSGDFPPLWPVSALVLAKCGGFMLYKELDRDALTAQGIQSTITLLSPILTTTLALLSLASAIGVTVFMMPALAAFLPLAVPPLSVVLTQRFGMTHFRHRTLRFAGLAYFFAISLLAWTLLS